jgi:cytochrome c
MQPDPDLCNVFITQDTSLEGAVANPDLAGNDQQKGAQIFRERCAVCPGNDGAGGQAPRLNRSGIGMAMATSPCTRS